jgi:peptide-methionine (S)-S-oxide reductase
MPIIVQSMSRLMECGLIKAGKRRMPMKKVIPIIFILTLLGVSPLFLSAASPEKGKRVADTTVKTERAIFAGGCFWCMEKPFDELPGVISVMSGYTGGHSRNPTYKEVSAGGTGHAEAVEVVYDPANISYDRLVTVFWHNIDPTVRDRQFCDTGDQYRSAIFYTTEEQHRIALQSKAGLEKNKPFREPIVTDIVKAEEFYQAEEYHQKYYKKNPIRYKYYRNGCGRDRRLKELWGSSAGH